MKIGIIGSGHMGGTLGKLWAKSGHHVLFSSRHPEQLNDLVEEAGERARTGSVLEAANYGDVVLLSTGFAAVEAALNEARSLAGRILIDITNPVTWDKKEDRMIPLLPSNTTANETILQHEPHARIVKAFCHLTWKELMNYLQSPGQQPLGAYFCADDAIAKRVAAELIKECGLHPLDIGGLENARLIEIPGPLSQKVLPLKEAQKLLARVRTDEGIAA